MRLASLKVIAWTSAASGANTCLFTLSRKWRHLVLPPRSFKYASSPASLAQAGLDLPNSKLITGKGMVQSDLTRQCALHMLWKEVTSFIILQTFISPSKRFSLRINYAPRSPTPPLGSSTSVGEEDNTAPQLVYKEHGGVQMKGPNQDIIGGGP